ncbi:MAG: HAD family hydrolase [Anaerolineae bacterium]|nr:HAD family hydrolase [Anaerolineae bacterium]
MQRDFVPSALMLDFYGTVVADDDMIIERICGEIAEASPSQASAAEVGSYWYRVFADLLAECFGSSFCLQKDIEQMSLRSVLQHFECDLDPKAVSQPLYDYWECPEIYPESKEVLAQCKVPICLVSNIDNAELQSALAHNDLHFDMMVTSEDARAYKPRSEMFEKALSLLGMQRDDVLHVGDSLGSDVRGAKGMGIPVLWLNRRGRPTPVTGNAPDYISTDLRGVLTILEGSI